MAQDLMTAEYLKGKYCGYSKKGSVITLFLTEIDLATMYESINGCYVIEADVAQAGYCCSECGTIMDLEEDDGKFWVRYRNGEIKKMKCAICTGNTPHLQKELDYDISQAGYYHPL